MANVAATLGYVFAGACALAVLKSLIKRVQASSIKRTLKEKAKRKRTARDEQRAIYKKFLATLTVDEAKTDLIVDSTVVDLLRLQREKKVTAEEITIVFCKRALAFGEVSDACAEEFYQEAIEQARRVDARRAQNPDAPQLPLEGIPVSVKDQFHQKGADSTCGLAARCFAPSAEDGAFITAIRAAGGIPFVRTNVPQCLMLPESANDVWGTAKNPWSLAHSPGGSSGGEGALVAARASPLGLGTDIGGSIRIPAHFCGVYGFKPTPQRLVKGGVAVPRPFDRTGQEAVRSAAGPLANCVDDLTIVTKLWLSDALYSGDATAAPILFNDHQYKATTPLRIGYFEREGMFEPAGACRRAVKEAVEALRGIPGVELVPFEIPQGPEDMQMMYMQIMGAEGQMRGFVDGLMGEDLHPYYNSIYLASRLPKWLRPVLGTLLRALGEVRLAELATKAALKSTYEFWQLLANKQLYCTNFFKAWQDAKLDAVICPGGALPAFTHGASKDLLVSCSYTCLFNILHLPAGTVPVTVVRPDECHYNSEYRDSITKKAHTLMTKANGLPVGVQVATLPFRDETCLRVMKLLEERVGFKQRPPQTW